MRVYEQLMRSINTGSDVTVDARYIDEFNYPNFFSPIIGDNKQFSNIRFSSVKIDEKIPAKLIIFRRKKNNSYLKYLMCCLVLSTVV